MLCAVMASGRMAVPVDAATPLARRNHLASALGLTVIADSLMAFEFGGSGEHQGMSYRLMMETQTPVLGILTSGSSGEPKLVAHRAQSLWANASAAVRGMRFHGDAKTLLSLPLFHIGGVAQVLRCLVSETTLVISGVVEDGDCLRRHRITHCSMVATQLQRLLDSGPGSLPALEVVLLGGGPSAPALIERGRAQGIPLWLTYGMSETASQIMTINPQGEVLWLGNMVLRLTDEQEIVIRGDTLFAGYWQQGQLHPARDHEGWFHTRDTGQWQDGRLVLTGRLDNQFISGGKNVQPEEIERSLLALEGVDAAVVVPVEHPQFGQTPFAFVRLQQGSLTSVDRDNLIASLKCHLPGYLVPRYYADLPAPQGLKIRRPELRALANSIGLDK